MSFLYWKAHNWMQDSRCGLMRADEKGIVTPLDPLAVLLFVHTWLLSACFAARAHCWLLPHSPATTTSQDLLSRAAPQLVTVQLVLLQGFPTSHEKKICICFGSISEGCWWPAPSYCLGRSEWQPCPQEYLLVPPLPRPLWCHYQMLFNHTKLIII